MSAPPVPEIAPSICLMTVAQLAAALGVTENAIYIMRHNGELPPAIKIGRNLRWREADIDAWLDSLQERPA